MNLTLKALILSALAMMAMGAFAVMNAAAEQDSQGHFTSEAANTLIKGTETGTHGTELTVPGLTGIVCDGASYSGTVSSSTVQSVTVTPNYSQCKTTGGTAGETVVHVNGCQLVFTISKKSTGDNTVDLDCPGPLKAITVTHSGCEIQVYDQNNINGVAYWTDVQNDKHSLTLEATASVGTHFTKGFCTLLGTFKISSLTGSVTVTGVGEPTGTPVGITATGSEG